MTRLSIIVPTLNEAPGIVATLERLQRMRTAGHEVIVADGGSGDATRALAAPLADRVLTAPRGRASQMNAGAALARGDVLLFLHADTRLPADAGRLILDGLASSGRAWGRFDVRIEGTHPLLRTVAWLMNLRSRLTGIATGDQAIFARRSVFEEVGGYQNAPLMEDIALFTEIKRRGRVVALDERVVVSPRRWLKRGVWRTVLLMYALRFGYWIGLSPMTLKRFFIDVR